MPRLLAYIWAFPVTLLGGLFFILPALLTGGRASIHTGVIEIYGGAIAFFLRRCTLLPGGASAMTFGHVVIAKDAKLLASTRSHERIHVRQCERWGPFFIPAYLLCSLWLLIIRKRPYMDNPFEREAYAKE